MTMKILVVDDDKLIRNWLTMLIRQITSPDLEIHAVNDAPAALDFCHKNEVNLVITDITMPQMSGLELLAALRESYPDMEVAVLSAYDNYEYIRQALRLGAIDYILKAEMKLSDITALLQKVRIFSNYSSHAPEAEETTFHEYGKHLNDYLEDTITTSDFLSRLPLTTRNLAVESFALKPEEEALPPEQVMDLCARTLSTENLSGCPFFYQDCFLVLYSLPDEAYEYRQETQQKVSLLLERNISNYLHRDSLASDRFFCGDTDHFHDVLVEHLWKMESCLYYGQKDPGVFRHLGTPELSDATRRLRSKLELHSYQEALDLFQNFVDDCHDRMIYLYDLRVAVLYCITVFLESTAILKDSSTFAAGYHRISKRINLAGTKERMLARLKEFYELYMLGIRDLTNTSAISPSIRKATDYILCNYRNHITLEDIANHIYLNKTYISQLFKRDLDTSFGSYLESVRISKAQELLRSSSMNVTQIAEEVGYTSQSYFTKVFKKKVGMGPLKYRSMTAPSAGSMDYLSPPDRH
ncbi:response regulator transcription factor [Anaerolentibacter hominis]|uniref:response regulator transcription factor n=1 Tax=Anaerolentibacter hominis TaxID=3079009 RepID=UPI0031B82A43